ncbi:6-pyruvoyl-tetrahydropterin synthase-related protein [Caldithrix abyssi]
MAAKKQKKSHPKKQAPKKTSGFTLSPRTQDYLAVAFLFFFLLILLKPLAIDRLSPQGVDVLGSIAKMHSVREYKQQTGEQALFNPNLFAGMPIYHRLSPKAFSLDNLISRMSRLLHAVFWYYLLGALGGFLLFRYLGMSPLISLLGGLLFVLFPHYKSLYTEGHMAKLMALMYLPWVFLTFRYLLDKKTLLSMALFALAFGLQIRTQHYQIVFYTGLAVFALGIYPVIKNLLDKDWASAGKTVGLSLVALILAVAMAAQPLFLAKEYLPYSKRGKTTVDVKQTGARQEKSSGVSFDYATQWSTHPSEIFTWLLPHFYGGMSGEQYDGSKFPQLKNQRIPGYWGHMPFTQSYEYMGLIILMLAVIGLIANWRDVTIRSLFFLLLVLVLLSFGRHFALFYHLFFDYFPFFNKFRAPMMSVTVSYFIIVIFAVYGFKYLLELRRDKVDWKQQKLILYTFGAFFALGVIFWLYSLGASFSKVGETYQGQTLEIIKQIRQELFQRDLIRYFVLLILTGGALFAFLKNKLSTWALILVLGLLQIGDSLQVQSRVKPQYTDIKRLERQHFRPTEIDRFLKSDKDLFRIFPAGQLFSDNRWVYFHQSIGGYTPIKMYAIEELVEKNIYNGWDRNLPINWNVLKILNVKYVITQQQLQHPFLRLVKSDPAAKLYAYYFTQYLPRAFFVGQAQVIKDEVQRLHTINSREFDPAATAILEEELTEPISQPDSSFTKVLKFTPNELQLQVYTDKQSLLVISEVYYPPGWKIFIDNRPVQKIYKTDHAIQSIVVPAGEHTVVLKFEPDSYFRNIKISYASLGIIYLILLGSLAGHVLRRKKGKV